MPHHIHTGKVCKSCISHKPRQKGREVGSREWLVLEDRACRLGTLMAPISLHCTLRNKVNSLPFLLSLGSASRWSSAPLGKRFFFKAVKSNCSNGMMNREHQRHRSWRREATEKEVFSKTHPYIFIPFTYR